MKKMNEVFLFFLNPPPFSFVVISFSFLAALGLILTQPFAVRRPAL